MSKRDDWHKPRGHNGHLEPDEIAFVRKSFWDKRDARDVARSLRCSTRIIQKYYAQFRGDGGRCSHRPQRRPRASRAGADSKPQNAAPAPARPSRFYKSNFEL